MRPGVSLYEQLLADEETTTRTPHAKLPIALVRGVLDNLLEELLPWLMLHRVLTDDVVRRHLRHWVAEYQPTLATAADAQRAAASG